MVASDYAIKLIGLLYEDDLDAISVERKRQLDELKRIIKDNKQT